MRLSIILNKELEANHFLKLGKALGLNVLEENLKENYFYVRFKKA